MRDRRAFAQWRNKYTYIFAQLGQHFDVWRREAHWAECGEREREEGGQEAQVRFSRFSIHEIRTKYMNNAFCLDCKFFN